jgi:hypothetical protein
MSDWKSTISAEINQCDDPEYAEQLQLAVDEGFFNLLFELGILPQARPLAAEVEAALQQLSQVEWSGQHAWAAHLRRLERTKKEDIPLEELIKELKSYHWLRRFIARHVLFYRGGEAVELLQTLSGEGTPEMQQIAAWLLRSISVEVTERLAPEPESWVCTRCFSRCHAFHLLWNPLSSYYGCRACKRSYGLAYSPQGIVCVLEADWREKYGQQDKLLRVNWLMVRTIFDFDYVEIIQATDEEVERFAVQVGNDTDPTREGNYSQIPCSINKACHLSENTKRVLDSTFGVID